MGVKKKHEHESSFCEEHMMAEPTRTHGNHHNEWHSYKSQTSRSIASTQQINGETDFMGKSLDLIVGDYPCGVGATDHRNNYSSYSGSKHSTSSKRYKDDNFVNFHMYNRENMRTSTDKKGKHSSGNNNHNQGFRIQHGEISDSVQQKGNNDAIVISDEDDDDDLQSKYTHKHNINDGKHSNRKWINVPEFKNLLIQYFVSLIQQVAYASRSNGHHIEPLSSNDIVDITGEGDGLNDDDDYEYDERYFNLIQ